MSSDVESTGGRYQVVCSLAEGGMGKVELALRSIDAFERLFALKRLRGEYMADPSVLAMLFDEARIAGLIRHPNVVSVLDVGEDEAGPFLLMEFVDGASVSQLIKRGGPGGLPLEVALRVAIQAAEGLHAAHELKDAGGKPLELVHRDVSPQNILVGFDGVARVTDFGIAKALGRDTRTSTGILKGKLGYLSPEQLRFEDLDRRADLFALGVTLFEMLSGARLYSGPEVNEVARRILTEPPPDIQSFRDDVPPEVEELLFELLAKQRELRPASAKDVARRLEDALRFSVPEGGLEVGDYVESLFASDRAKLQQTLQRFRSSAGALQVASPSSDPTPAVMPATSSGPKPTPPKRARWLAAGLVLVLTLFGFWWGLGALSRTKSPPVAEPSEPTKEQSAVAAAPLASDPARISSASPANSAPPEGPVKTSNSAVKSKPSPPNPGPPRKPASKKGLPLWEDY
ncbi:MAG: protein kinase [Polyangiaceae bacterium]|nr:protein kinase [Polyangiaceae bacterium]MCB9609504.1 protein kinase [Polyangiaceae bacterium]